MELYINGFPESLFGALSDQGADWQPQWGGQIPAGSPLQLKFGPESLTGAIDEVVILNRALDGGEVVQLMTGWQNVPIPEPSSLTLLTLGVFFLGTRRRRRN